jgi:hypothetical protein
MDDNPARLAGFIRRQCGERATLATLNVWQASRAIEGLKNLLARQQQETLDNSASD